ncbi:4-alpha-glucanotransferase [Catenovulum sp. 2E275]|uniref:4-alpha-glucanotransferase n=1 Tax=Catenovulum sp. 2E275 TaxID=2980497 RepID=UPI0021D36547|nr:4-alpha-glucanotransferase [Catenovulum sp. 2E275]MCU4677369.1 4-alpha-glucanotransferase [Catenovulum sp. 2E275]
MDNELIDQVAKARGIETQYMNAWGKEAQVEPGSKAKLLKAMGYAIDNKDKLLAQLEDEKCDYWLSLLNPVTIIRDDESIEFELRVPIVLATQTLVCKIQTEQDETISQDFSPINFMLVDAEVVDELEYQEYLIELNAKIGLGYHTLALFDENNNQIASQSLIIAPQRCYQPDPIMQGHKVWGTSIQLYCLKSETNWGIGDFSDLNFVVSQIAKLGGQFVGLNPIHALYPANPNSCSPYSPSSRRWLNIFYIDPQVVEGFAQSEQIQQRIHSSEHLTLLAQAREAEYVDYDKVAKLKLPVFDLLFNWFKQQHLNTDSAQAKSFNHFIEQGGESLKLQACFDAIQESLIQQDIQAWGWPSWPEHLAEFEQPQVNEFIEKHADRILFFQYLQWIAQNQLENCQQTAEQNNMMIGLYRDLAVGVSSGSAEVWANRDLYCAELSVGAPPDPLGPQGQSWGLPPMDPNQLYKQNYQPIIDMYRANMQACGALRIDHVMALLRLWWVPGSEHATQGAYVYYPIDDLLAILCLESQRNQCMIVGEDLGTVPEGIREVFAENGLLSYRVFFFETAPDGGYYSPVHYPKQAMAALTTHDLPTLKGFWHCLDLDLGQKLGVYPDEDNLNQLRHSRHHSKQRILDSLHGHGVIDPATPRDAMQVAMSKSLNFDIQTHMAHANSVLLSLQLEDWLEMDLPVNVPGTCDEYPNWRRKLSHSLTDIFSQPDIQALANKLTQVRGENLASD